MLSLCAALASAQTSAPGAAQPRKVQVNEITVSGNTLLPQAAIDALMARYKGERSIDELKDAAASLQSLYRQAGYGAVVAYLPEQALGNGSVKLAVLEGKVASVEVLGNRQFSAENVRRALPALQTGQTPRVQALDAQLQLANENPARKLALTVEAGTQTGDVDARVNVVEDAVSRWTVSADNTGNAQTGRMRLGLAYQNAALFDRDHQLAVQAQFSPEHPEAVRIFSANYRVPLYSAGVMLGFYGTYSNVDAGSTPTAAGALLFNGKGQVLGMSAMRLFQRLGEFDQRLTLSIDSRDYLNNCAIEGLPAGACGIAGESVSVYPLTLDYSLQRGGDRPLAVSVAYSHNLALGGRYGHRSNFDAVRPGAQRDYQVLRINAFGALPVGRDWRVGLRLASQISGDALVPGEQFGLTGASTVRGYEERELTGDSGIAANFEVTSPAWPVWGDGQLRLVGFFDAGSVRNELGTFCNATSSSCSLSSTGLGLRFGRGQVQLKLDVARALRAGRLTENHSTRAHFQASVSF